MFSMNFNFTIQLKVLPGTAFKCLLLYLKIKLCTGHCKNNFKYDSIWSFMVNKMNQRVPHTDLVIYWSNISTNWEICKYKLGSMLNIHLIPSFYICSYTWYSFSNTYHVRKLINLIFILHFTHPPHGNEHLHILVKIYTYNTVKNIKNIRNRRFIVTLYRHRNLISNEI